MNRQHPIRPERSPTASAHIVDLDAWRLERLARAVAEARSRLDRLQRQRIRIEVEEGRTWRELARRQRELTLFRQQILSSERTVGESSLEEGLAEAGATPQ